LEKRLVVSKEFITLGVGEQDTAVEGFRLVPPHYLAAEYNKGIGLIAYPFCFSFKSIFKPYKPLLSPFPYSYPQ